MKKLLSLILTIAMISTILVSTTLNVGAAITSSGFDFNYEGNLTGLSLTNASRTDAVGGRTGKVLALSRPADFENSVNVQINNINDTVNSNNTGIWIFENDLYIPEAGIPDGAKATMQFAPDSAWGDVYRFHITSEKQANSNACMTSWPTNKWFTLKFEFDYTPADSKNDTLNISTVIDGAERTVARLPITVANWQSKGFVRFGLYADPGVTYYLDNMKYYQKYATRNIYDISGEESVHYYEDFDSGTQYNFTSTGTTWGTLYFRRGHTSGISLKTIDDPTNSGKGKVFHYRSASSTNWDSTPQYVDIQTNRFFRPYVTGVQVVEASYYIPSTGDNASLTNSSECIVLHIATYDTEDDYGFQQSMASVKLGRHPEYTPSSTNDVKAPLDKWFKVRFIVNYNNHVIESQIIEDGVTKTIETKTFDSLGATVKSRVLANGIEKLYFTKTQNIANSEYYLDDIKYYESDNIPSLIDFEKNKDANSSDYTVLTAGVVAYAVEEVLDDTISHGKSMKLSFPSITAEENTKSYTINLDTKLDLIGANKGITSLTTDFYIPEVLSDVESLSINPCTDDRDEADTGTTPIGSGMQSTVHMKGANIIGNVATVAYPVGEWFTIRFTYNLNTHYYNYYLIEADGTETLLAEFVNTGTVGQVAKNGIKRVRYQYKLPVGKALETEKSYYIDNIKFSNGTYGDIALADNGTYTASVDYASQGEVVTNTKLVLAQYNASNELLTINMYTPVFSDGTGTYKVENIAKAEGATKVKLMYVDSVGSMYPLATSIEK